MTEIVIKKYIHIQQNMKLLDCHHLLKNNSMC